MNSGDRLNKKLQINKLYHTLICHKNVIFYSDVLCPDNNLIKSKIKPSLLKMPHHQSMIIPKSFFITTKYRYPEYITISADLDLKLAIIKYKYFYKKLSFPLSIVDITGISSRIDLSTLNFRAKQMYEVSKNYNNRLTASFHYLIYILYYFKKMFS